MHHGELGEVMLKPKWEVELRFWGRLSRGAPVGKVSIDQEGQLGDIGFLSSRELVPNALGQRVIW